METISKVNENLITRKEASKLLKISLVTLRRWTVDGLFPSYYLGGRVYYKHDEIMSSLHKVEGAA